MNANKKLLKIINECRKPYTNPSHRNGATDRSYADGYNDASNDIADSLMQIVSEKCNGCINDVVEWEDPTGFSIDGIKDEANNWTRRETGREMLLNYAAALEHLCKRRGGGR